ncbi:MAG: hypothetical protein M3Y56_10960, partial [Armatimonadota bacterium]|nr:hypothetical protein [Armatimonadota bacterium]
CYVEKDKRAIGSQPRIFWAQERAERIGWIGLALLQPFEIRPATGNSAWFAYVLVIEGDSQLGTSTEYFGVITRPTTPHRVELMSAYPLDPSTIRKWKDGGRKFYPPQPAKPKKRRKKH